MYFKLMKRTGFVMLKLTTFFLKQTFKGPLLWSLKRPPPLIAFCGFVSIFCRQRLVFSKREFSVYRNGRLRSARLARSEKFKEDPCAALSRIGGKVQVSPTIPSVWREHLPLHRLQKVVRPRSTHLCK